MSYKPLALAFHRIFFYFVLLVVNKLTALFGLFVSEYLRGVPVTLFEVAKCTSFSIFTVFILFYFIFKILTSAWMKTCTIARTSSTSALILAARTSVNAIRVCTLLMENAEVRTI